jgi:hypothetical protein
LRRKQMDQSEGRNKKQERKKQRQKEEVKGGRK